MTVDDAQLRHHNQGSCHGITCVGQGGRPNTLINHKNEIIASSRVTAFYTRI